MSKHIVIVNIQDGRITNRTEIVKTIWGLKNGKYKFEISSFNTRSLAQNRFYWGLVIPMIQKGFYDMGTEIGKEEVHEFLKVRFNYNEVINKGTGEYVYVPKSTAGLNKEEFAEYIEKIQRFASEFLNVVIPDPNKQMVIEY